MDYARMLAREVSPVGREMKREMWNARFQSLGRPSNSANGDHGRQFPVEDVKEGVWPTSGESAAPA